LKQKTLEVRF